MLLGLSRGITSESGSLFPLFQSQEIPKGFLKGAQEFDYVPAEEQTISGAEYGESIRACLPWLLLCQNAPRVCCDSRLLRTLVVASWSPGKEQ